MKHEILDKATAMAEIEKNYDKIMVLLRSGVFDLESGQAEINFNNNQIQSVFFHKMTYKRTKSFT